MIIDFIYPPGQLFTSWLNFVPFQKLDVMYVFHQQAKLFIVTHLTLHRQRSTGNSNFFTLPKFRFLIYDQNCAWPLHLCQRFTKGHFWFHIVRLWSTITSVHARPIICPLVKGHIPLNMIFLLSSFNKLQIVSTQKRWSRFQPNLVTSIYGWLATKVITFRDLKFDLGVTGVKKGQILKLFQLQQD